MLVHIHGGGFVIGAGDSDYSQLAKTGHAVVVSFNYRLGILGFLADPALGAHSGDWGLQDQYAALRWVQHNIGDFGGDASNVTIFGESAGGSSVCDAIASPAAKGLFQRAISVSGEYNTVLGSPTALESQDCKSDLPSQDEADQAGTSYAAVAGCSDPATAATCLRSLSIDAVESAAGSGFQSHGHGTVAPTINGVTLTQSLHQALQTGSVNRVTVIAGTGRDEDLAGTATTAADYTDRVRQQYGTYADAVLARYPVSHFGTPAIAFRTVAADSNTVCPALRTDDALARRMPTYAYELDDNDLPPYDPTTPAGSAPGAEHIGGWFLRTRHTALDADQQALQSEELATVAGFARTGDPSAPGTPEWPRYLNTSSDVMSLQPAGDSELVSATQLRAQHDCAFWDTLTPSN